MAQSPKPVRDPKWKIPAIANQNKSFWDSNNIRVFTLQHWRGFYGPPYYRVDMYKPATATEPEMWIPLLTPNGKEVWFFDTLAEAEDKGVKEAQKEQDKWPTATVLPSLPEEEQQPA